MTLLPRGSIDTTIMELGPQNHSRDGLMGPNSIMVLQMDPPGLFMLLFVWLFVLGVLLLASEGWLRT